MQLNTESKTYFAAAIWSLSYHTGEKIVGEIFRQHLPNEFSAHATKDTHDEGIDMIASLSTPIIDSPIKIVGQLKQRSYDNVLYKSEAKEWWENELHTKHKDSDRIYFIVTNEVRRDVEEYLAERDVKVWDFDKLYKYTVEGGNLDTLHKYVEGPTHK